MNETSETSETSPRLFARPGSHYTRVARIFAEECAVPCELVIVPDLNSTDVRDYGGNPCLQVPALELAKGRTLWGTENICRTLHRLSSAPPRVVWPAFDNAWELVRHAMDVEVQLVLKRNPVKARASLQHALSWLDANVDAVLRGLPARDFSLLEVTLFCLLEHIAFRKTLEPAELEPFSALRRVTAVIGSRASAARTVYREIGALTST